MNNPFSFLICSERSGSNFVTKILDSHSQICGPSPVHLLRYFVPLEAKYGALSVDNNWFQLVDDVLMFFQLKISAWEAVFTQGELRAIRERSLAGLFRYIYLREAEIHGKRNIFVKENHAYKLIPYYQHNFPGSKFIWAIRDPRDMALSWKNDAVLRGGVVRSAGIWKEDQKMSYFMYSYLGPLGQMLKVKYEDLTANTESEALRITQHLGFQFEADMAGMKGSKSSEKNAIASAGWSNLNKGVMKNNSRKYLEGLSKEEIQFIEFLNRDEMAALGYEAEFPIISRTDFIELQHQLSLEEKWEKEQYKSLSSEEISKRKIWVTWVNDLQARLQSAF